jgi:hypothetical protein
MARSIALLGWVCAISLIAIAPAASAQSASATIPADVEKPVRDADAGYWQAFNACDAKAMGQFLAEGFEFYHDRGGVTLSRTAMVDATMKGICGNPNVKVRRVPLPDTIRFDPIPGYGGVLTGRHQFYQTETGMPERLTGTAWFTMLWHYDQGRWLLTRGLSLDHQPVPYAPPQPGLALPDKALDHFAGRYVLPNAGDILITRSNGRLLLSGRNLNLTFAPRTISRFFALERPLQIEFSGEAGGRATIITVIENGAPVETGKRAD